MNEKMGNGTCLGYFAREGDFRQSPPAEQCSQVCGSAQTPTVKTIANQIEELEKALSTLGAAVLFLEDAVYQPKTQGENSVCVPKSTLAAESIAECVTTVRALANRIEAIGRTVGGQLQGYRLE